MRSGVTTLEPGGFRARAGAWPRIAWTAAISAAVVVGGCTNDATEPRAGVRSPGAQQRVLRFEVDFLDREGYSDGVVRLDSARSKVCLALRMRPPRGAHLHRRASLGPDDILVTFYEPPASGKRRVCVEGAESHVVDLLTKGARRVYVDLHYGARSDSVVGSVIPLE